MNISWDPSAWEDYVEWQETNPSVRRKINALLKECLRTPFAGTGKPEPLKGNLSGFWSRRINQEHRLLYEVSPDRIHVVQCREHY